MISVKHFEECLTHVNRVSVSLCYIKKKIPKFCSLEQSFITSYDSDWLSSSSSLGHLGWGCLVQGFAYLFSMMAAEIIAVGLIHMVVVIGFQQQQEDKAQMHNCFSSLFFSHVC